MDCESARSTSGSTSPCDRVFGLILILQPGRSASDRKRRRTPSLPHSSSNDAAHNNRPQSSTYKARSFKIQNPESPKPGRILLSLHQIQRRRMPLRPRRPRINAISAQPRALSKGGARHHVCITCVSVCVRSISPSHQLQHS